MNLQSKIEKEKQLTVQSYFEVVFLAFTAVFMVAGQYIYNVSFNSDWVDKQFGYFKIFLAFSPVIALFLTGNLCFLIHFRINK